MSLVDHARQVIDMYVENREVHGHSHEQAVAEVLQDLTDAAWWDDNEESQRILAQERDAVEQREALATTEATPDA